MRERVTFNFVLSCPSIRVIQSARDVQVEFTDSCIGRSRIVVRADQDGLRLLAELTFQFDPAVRNDEARKGALSIRDRLVNSLAIRAGLAIGASEFTDDLEETRLRASVKPLATGDAAGHASVSMSCSAALLGCRSYPPNWETHLGHDLLRPTIEPLLATYQLAINSHQAAAEFFLLYAILAAVFGTQGKVDDALDPQRIRRTPSSEGRNAETPFTRIRNTLAHPKDRPQTLEEATAEARTLLPELREHTRVHMLRFLGFPE